MKAPLVLSEDAKGRPRAELCSAMEPPIPLPTTLNFYHFPLVKFAIVLYNIMNV